MTELRFFSSPVRMVSDHADKIEGHAALYNVWSLN
jgi:hypothetical protein